MSMVSRTERLKFVHNLPSEQYLRDEILIPLFQNMNKFHTVKTHGSDEKGKDIVLIGKDEFGHPVYQAIIAKNESINMGTTKKDQEIFANISNQIVTCIDTGYECTTQKRTVYFNKIIVLTSHTVSNKARPELIKLANSHKFTSIVFWEDEDLVDLIDLYLPEIYFIGRGSLSKYFYSLKQKCENLNELKNISIYKGDAKKIADIFIEPVLFRKEERIINKQAVSGTQTARIYDLVSLNNNYLIYGAAGSGKSTLTRSAVTNLIIRYEDKKNKKVPLFIKVKDFVLDSLEDSELDISTNLKKYIKTTHCLTDEDVDSLFSLKDQLLLFLDGYDELSLPQELTLFDKLIEFIKKTPNCQFVITSRRRLDLIEQETRFKGVQQWKISQFNIKQIQSFLEKWFNNKDNYLLSALKDHNLIEKLPRTPLVITLIAILFESDRNVEIPSNLSELYKMFIELLLGRWNLDRRLSNFYQANDKETFLTEIALFFHMNNIISCTEEELRKVFTKTEEKLGRKIDYDKMLHELIVNTNLIVKNEKGNYEFRHLSFQEYFVANEMVIKNKGKDLINFFPNDWWNQVLYFFCGIRKDNEDILPKIIKKIYSIKKDGKIKAIWELGYFIQSSYKTHASLRKKLIKEAIKEYAKTAQEAIEEFIQHNKNIPEILVYLSLIFIFKIHFKSRYLLDIFKEVYAELTIEYKRSFEHAFGIFLICSLIAESGELDYLVESERYFKGFPVIELLVDAELRIRMEEIEDKSERRAIKAISNNIIKRIKRSPSLYKKYIE